MIKNNQYFARKTQLVEAMKEKLLGMPYGFSFNEDMEPRYFKPMYCGEPREERLCEVYLTDPDDYAQEVVVSTAYEDEYGYELIDIFNFDEFSNEEMETIMRLCGVEIPLEGEFYME